MNFHIVGFGLAGALLAWELRKLGAHVTFEDDADKESSSRVAAGMITPITGKRLKPTWQRETLTTLALDTYRDIEVAYSVQLVRCWWLRRVFREEIQNEWFLQRCQNGEYNGIHVKSIPPGAYNDVQFPYGGFEHDGVYTVDITTLIDTLRNSISGETEPRAPFITVHCTGHKALLNEHWRWLPLEPSKGEILDVRIPGLALDHILTNGTWILPMGNNLYRIGATHDWDDQSPEPTKHGREQLLAAARELTSAPIEVTRQRAAIRPSTKFKRPIVGIHPVHGQHAIFTGLGTKGALQGPWAARVLARHLVLNEPLNAEINVLRWYTQ